jgi:dihydropteroate synthase
MTKTLFAGSRQIDLSSPLCMGVLNVTPDSFSDGASLGRESAPNPRQEAFVVDLDKVLYRAEEMVAEGASFLDIGGESTRPGATPVPVHEEIERVVPVVAALKARFDICLSVDTSSAEVMKAAIGAGAELVNDVRALADDRALSAIVDNRVAVCLMHMRGQPRSMQAVFEQNKET